MIACLKWEIIDLEFNKVVILTSGGVGYDVLINEINFSKIQNENRKNLELFIYHHRTENSQLLFGFLEKDEKIIFEELIKINWVWGKVALNILSIWIYRLSKAIASWDNKTIESIKWIGKKWASKIILELNDSDVIKSYKESNWDKNIENNLENVTNISQDIHNDVKNTLTLMWYNLSDIEKVLAKLPEDVTTINDIIPFVIKNI